MGLEIFSQGNSERNVLEELAQGVVGVPSVEEEEGEEEEGEEEEDSRNQGTSEQQPPQQCDDDDLNFDLDNDILEDVDTQGIDLDADDDDLLQGD